MTLSWFLDSIQ